MHRIVLNESLDAIIDINDIKAPEAIFAKHDGLLVGMVIEEDKGWILKLGDSSGPLGHHATFKKCIVDALHHGYTFYVDR